MRNLLVITVLLSAFSGLCQLETLKTGSCPAFLLAKKLPAKSFYHPVTLEKLNLKNVELMASVGCVPRSVIKLTTEQLKTLLKREYDEKLAKVGI